ncbi:MAG TPA: hypothetical protein DCS07_13270 [Bdellovibrionales bacterium]|nr:MAG: hypothetical protein A2Z97_15110 [Bdellovibrionales bacterium GWB1_52_6]OFZ03432.1 MAG: hypothetical protein A2X97_05655 [Bdellovibrionales bacterium GWA1_52_35]OFZ37802.1 MAG: hypothetical protein A2070_15115 [Bdellovibrionales bacterium GWC1_52_8]HAR43577.1 hypothetical protein [Bdellovibrionales bacterium]
MHVPENLQKAFGDEFQELIGALAAERGLIPDAGSTRSERFMARSVVPHVKKLSALFNREEVLDQKEAETARPAKAVKKEREALDRSETQAKGLDPYWKESSNPAHLRLAYFLYFMPSNLFRVASVWAELARLGFRWPENQNELRAIEFGAGPATGACGIAAAERFSPLGLPKSGSWALIEQDKAVLQLGCAWAEKYFPSGDRDWGIRPFHRKVDLTKGLLPRNAPSFNLWVMSYFLNEIWSDPAAAAKVLLDAWERHLTERGVVILVEPALKYQSRKLLQLRQELLLLAGRRGCDWLKILLPCLGHQECGALKADEDWCHEDVSWWRPPYFRIIDKMAGLDRRNLPFSYLVITRDSRPQEEILSALKQGATPCSLHRLVSPCHGVGQDLEFYLCGKEGKSRARFKEKLAGDLEGGLGRGDILADARIRGDSASKRVESVKKVVR